MTAQSSPFDRLWHAYHREGDADAKARLVQRFRPMLISLAEQVHAEMGGQPDLQDLINAGMIGLLEAFDRFDPSRGVYFETYCRRRVVGAMHDDQRRFDWATAPLRLKAQRLRAAREELTAATGRPPSDDELCEALGISHREMASIRHHASRPAPLSNESHRTDPDTGPPRGADAELLDARLDPERLALAEEARVLLLDAVKALPDKQRYVLLLYYFERLKMADIGRILDLSEARISQLHKEALGTLVQRLGPRRTDFLDALGL
ncbi:MAG: sigma-70 family RNA polymerase sigma factor [Planctomycetota bacterium]